MALVGVLLLALAPVRSAAAQESPLQLGTPRNITASVSLYRPLGVDVGPNGAFFICNSGDAQIVKLSFEGKPIWRVGGTGQGPGEFELLYRIAVGADGGVAAFDMGNQDLSWFAAGGTFIRRVNLETRVHGVGSIALLPDGSVAMVAHLERAPDHSIHVFDTKGLLVRSFGPVPPVEDEIQLHDWMAGFLYRSGAELIFTLNVPYEVYRFSPTGELLQDLRRAYEFLEGPGGEVPVRGAQRAGYGPPRFVAHPLGAKDLGDGWLIAGIMPEPDRVIWDLFRDGDLIASYPAPNNWVVVDTDPERHVLYVQSEDAAGERIYLQVPYKIPAGAGDSRGQNGVTSR